MIQFSNLVKKYKGIQVLEVENLTVTAGSCFGLVGNNGAGKTTLFSVLLDLVQPTEGYVVNKEIRVNQSEDWKTHTTAFIDESFLIGYLTPEEYFEFIGQARQSTKTEWQKVLETLQPFFNGTVLGQNKYIRDMSKGNQKKVGLAAAFFGNPELIVLDEPFANLDPSSQIQLKKFIALQKQKGITFLISSHDLSHVTEICERIVLLEKGKPIKDIETSPSTLKELESYFAA